jgi:hypothetical protein
VLSMKQPWTRWPLTRFSSQPVYQLIAEVCSDLVDC